MRSGYKQTEVGAIPEDWEVKGLLELAHIANGQVDPRKQPFRSMPLVAPDHIQSGTGRLLAIKSAEEQHAISGKYLFTPGDIVYSKIRPYLRKAILAEISGLCSADMYPLTPTEGNSGRLLLELLLSHRFTKYAESVSVRSGMPKINRAELADFRVAVPAEPDEQIAIASALEDADKAAEGLERLIAKKRDLKQAAIQQLLTGQTRLPGFSGAWAVKRLGDLGRFLKGSGVRRDQSLSGELPCVRYGEIYTTYNDVVRTFRSFIALNVAKTALLIQRGDLLFAASGETKEDIGKCVAFLFEGEAYAGGDIIVLRPSSCCSHYLGYLLNTESLAKQKANLGQGDAVVHISSASLAKLEFHLPDVNEQAAIATVLSDMDDELSALQAQLDKTRLIKQAMKQDLLTGRVRLPFQ